MLNTGPEDSAVVYQCVLTDDSLVKAPKYLVYLNGQLLLYLK